MKKLLIAVLTIGLLAGCGSKLESSSNAEKATKNEVNTTETAAKTEAKTEVTKQESKYPFPNSAPIGDAKLTVRTPAGSSEGGNVPVVFVKPDEVLVQVGVDLENFDGSKQTFIYLDKFFQSTEQAGILTQTNIDLKEDGLKPGIHTVTAVQFENDDPAAGKVVNFVEAKVEVKAAK